MKIDIFIIFFFLYRKDTANQQAFGHEIARDSILAVVYLYRLTSDLKVRTKFCLSNDCFSLSTSV